MATRVVSERRRLVLFRAGASALLLVAAGEVAVVLANLRAPFADRPSVEELVQMALAHVTTLIACAVGLALVWRAAHRPAARALAWFLGFFALFWSSVYVSSILDDDAPGMPRWLAALAAASGLIIYVSIWLAPAAFLRFSMLFPRPLAPEDLVPAHATQPGAGAAAGAAPAPGAPGDPGRSAHVGRRLLRAWVPARLGRAAAGPARRALRLAYWFRRRLLNPRPVWGTALVAGSVPFIALGVKAVTGFEDVGGDAPLPVTLGVMAFAMLIVVFVLVVVPAVIVAATLNLRLSYRLADAADRRRIRWVVDGCVVGVVALFVNPVLGSALGSLGLDHPAIKAVPGTIFAIGLLAMVICLAVGVFYDGALESALIVRRSAVYTAFGVLLTFLFAGVESLVSSRLTADLGVPDGASSFLAGGAAALAFAMLRSTVARISGRGAPDSVKSPGATAAPERPS